MEKFLIPDYAKKQLTETQDLFKKVEETISETSKHLQDLISKRTELQGKHQGIVSLLVEMAGFDATKPITLKEDSIEGTPKVDDIEEIPQKESLLFLYK